MEGFGELGWVEYYQLLLFSFNDNTIHCIVRDYFPRIKIRGYKIGRADGTVSFF